MASLRVLFRENRILIIASTTFFFIGIAFWGAFNTVLDATNSLYFCVSCHEMESTVFQEYKTTVHYNNRSGVRAICSDCHVPHPWIYKMKRKIEASAEIYHKIVGTVDTVEKFDAHRLEMAKRVWDVMKSTDSRECRNCHSFEAMLPEAQKPRANGQHTSAMKDGGTCIDCHKGIAHKPVHKQLEANPAPATFDIQ